MVISSSRYLDYVFAFIFNSRRMVIICQGSAAFFRVFRKTCQVNMEDIQLSNMEDIQLSNREDKQLSNMEDIQLSNREDIQLGNSEDI